MNINRCFASGFSTAAFFKTHFKKWLREEACRAPARDSGARTELSKAATHLPSKASQPKHAERAALAHQPAGRERLIFAPVPLS